MTAALLLLAALAVAWFAFEIRRAPLVCWRCEMPVESCSCGHNTMRENPIN